MFLEIIINLKQVSSCSCIALKEMALPKTEKCRLPPRRGQIKERIISQLVKMVMGLGSELGRNLRRKKVTTTDHQETQPDQQERGGVKAFVVQ
ncbi:hypothetical protein FNV43_RR15995 [Rhamnella rubrinervis]|uniref:Uncharacterized protein n=1 Tax=Rhamnella rubrinervis TaxID=2594499 RepID=A0A8K0E9Z0_9ROSA|nr:hypothetical protein FNV43_RR15995 [Rhamnella rubrinervis]